jgi:hypothetical protein
MNATLLAGASTDGHAESMHETMRAVNVPTPEPEPTEPPLQVGPAAPLSGFSAIGFTFRVLERDFLGIVGPLFAAALVGSLDTLALGFVGFHSWVAVAALLAVWLPISSYTTAAMVRFCLRVARGQPYSFREVWVWPRGVPALVGLKLTVYAATGGVLWGLVLLAQRADHISKVLPGLLILAFFVVGATAFARFALAPVIIVDRDAGPLRALAQSARLTRRQVKAVVVYGVVLLMIAGMVHTVAATAVLATLAAPGIVFLYLALRGELVGV